MKQEITFGGLTARPGEAARGYAPLGDTGFSMPVTVLNGAGEGKTLILSSGLHGGEYPSIEAAIELARELDPGELNGQLVIFHPVNLSGFERRLSYLLPETGENLNRFFPGRPDGTTAERIAWAITSEYQDRADFFIDIHGGDLHEALPPYVYYPGLGPEETVEASRRAALLLNASYMVKSGATTGAYNSAALRGVPSLLIERGGRGLWTPAEVEDYKADLKNLFRHLGLLEGEALRPGRPATLITRAEYLDAGHSGCWYPAVGLEERVKEGQKLGEIRDVFGRPLEEIRAAYDGIVLFMTVSLAVAKGDPILTYGAP